MAQRTSAELKEAVKRVAEWRDRGEGGRGSRIPDELWQDAVQAARTVGVWTTAKALRFNYEALKSRYSQAAKRAAFRIASKAGPIARRIKPADVAPRRGDAEASFIALPVGQVGACGRAVIDLVGRHGDRMRLDVAGGVDVVGLVRTFWGSRS